ncbi:hypothetical protein CYMTET_26572 [Cymbomonas tetramitiformis]|uniref:Uncharacterized protein n=1 Tax=Cymbomonas tetramitiformis TaxID=36881 RepID=A0AAE0KXT2_9CHLO|nr:hypothetical protein CYMTET_26572 [Cymbomonas tetramitiformis]
MLLGYTLDQSTITTTIYWGSHYLPPGCYVKTLSSGLGGTQLFVNPLTSTYFRGNSNVIPLCLRSNQVSKLSSAPVDVLCWANFRRDSTILLTSDDAEGNFDAMPVWSVRAVVRPYSVSNNDIGRDRPIVFKRTSSTDDQYSFFLSYASESLFKVGFHDDEGTVHYASSFEMNMDHGSQWVTVEGAFDGNLLYILINGQLQGQALAPSSPHFGKGDLNIGCVQSAHGGTDSFDGDISSVEIWASSTSLMSQWVFDDRTYISSDGLLVDATNNKNDASVTGIDFTCGEGPTSVPRLASYSGFIDL